MRPNLGIQYLTIYHSYSQDTAMYRLMCVPSIMLLQANVSLYGDSVSSYRIMQEGEKVYNNNACLWYTVSEAYIAIVGYGCSLYILVKHIQTSCAQYITYRGFEPWRWITISIIQYLPNTIWSRPCYSEIDNEYIKEKSILQMISKG